MNNEAHSAYLKGDIETLDRIIGETNSKEVCDLCAEYEDRIRTTLDAKACVAYRLEHHFGVEHWERFYANIFQSYWKLPGMRDYESMKTALESEAKK